MRDRNAVDVWTDTIFSLFIEGEFEALSAGEVCRAIDWIASRTENLEDVASLEPDERRRHLARLVNLGVRRSAAVRAAADVLDS